MRQTIINICVLLAFPLTLLPIVLGAGDALEVQRKEHFWQMRLEHLHARAADRRRRAARLAREEARRKGLPARAIGEKP